MKKELNEEAFGLCAFLFILLGILLDFLEFGMCRELIVVLMLIALWCTG